MVKVNEMVYSITGMIEGIGSNVNLLNIKTGNNIKGNFDEFNLVNSDGYECFVTKIDENIKIQIVGFDDVLKSPININLFFKNFNETIKYMREVKFDHTLNYHLSLFVKQITKELYSNNWVNKDVILN
jgi:hypothetical protein